MKQLLAAVAMVVAASQAHAQKVSAYVGAGLAVGRDGTHVLGALAFAPTRTISARADVLIDSGNHPVNAALANLVYTRTLFSRTVYALVGGGVSLLDSDLPLAGGAGAGVRLGAGAQPLALEGRFVAAVDSQFLLTLSLRL